MKIRTFFSFAIGLGLLWLALNSAISRLSHAVAADPHAPFDAAPEILPIVVIKPGLMNMHIADSTCNGDCDTNLKVLVLPK